MEAIDSIMKFDITDLGECEFPPAINTMNSAYRACRGRPFFDFYNILSLVTVLMCLCGSVGNGTVIWLLGFCLKRSPFSTYILSLACADFTFLVSNGVQHTQDLLNSQVPVLPVINRILWTASYLAGLCLLMAISTERCVSVLCPIWYRCRRPAHLSSTVCALIWGLSLCEAIYEGVCEASADIPCKGTVWVQEVMVVITFLVLCVSGLMLLIRVHCGSRKTQPSRLYVTILLNVLAFLLLALPYTVCFFVAIMSYTLCSPTLRSIFYILFVLNCMVNPIIYFFVGRYRQQPGRTRLREVLQRALRDEAEGAEQGGTPVPTDTMMVP